MASRDDRVTEARRARPRGSGQVHVERVQGSPASGAQNHEEALWRPGGTTPHVSQLLAREGIRYEYVDRLGMHSDHDILRVLTAFSILLLPQTLIASIWGMNTHVPGGGTIGGFWIVISCMLVVTLGMLIYFRRRDWL